MIHRRSFLLAAVVLCLTRGLMRLAALPLAGTALLVAAFFAGFFADFVTRFVGFFTALAAAAFFFGSVKSQVIGHCHVSGVGNQYFGIIQTALHECLQLIDKCFGVDDHTRSEDAGLA